MANTYSSTLRLILQTTGENAGTWGTYTNTNIGTLLEQAITGIGAIAVSGSSNYTLTTANGASDEARNAVLVVGGTNSAIRKIVAPLVNKVYLVFNNTTGGLGLGMDYPNAWTNGQGTFNRMVAKTMDLWYHNSTAQCTQVMKMATTTYNQTPLLANMSIMRF